MAQDPAARVDRPTDIDGRRSLTWISGTARACAWHKLIAQTQAKEKRKKSKQLKRLRAKKPRKRKRKKRPEKNFLPLFYIRKRVYPFDYFLHLNWEVARILFLGEEDKVAKNGGIFEEMKRIPIS